METYDRAIQLLYKTWQYHFEFLNLGYAAYLDFFGFVKQQFPSIPDLAIATMVQGVDVDLFRPDDELKKLAKLAVRLGVADALKAGSVDEALAAVAARPGGREWIEAWEAAQDPWFNFTSGNGFYSTDKYWIDHLHIPLGYIRNYIIARCEGRGDRPADRAHCSRAGPHHRRVCRAARPGGAGGIRRQAGACTHRVSLCREPQFLHRALVDGGVLAQDARVERHAAQGRILA